MILDEASLIQSYFEAVTSRFKVTEPLSSVCITHVLPTAEFFLPALNRLTDVAAVLPKPKSFDPDVRAAIERLYKTLNLERSMWESAERAILMLEDVAARRNVVLLDVGGYFASALPEVCSRFSGTIVGVVEDTENGLQRYEAIDAPPCPGVLSGP